MWILYRKIWLNCVAVILAVTCLPTPGRMQVFAPLTVTISDSTATEGYYFLTPYTNTLQNNYDHTQLILDKFGRTVFYKTYPKIMTQTPTIDFKLQPNGWMSYFSIVHEKFYFMDSTFTVVDSIACTADYETDQHDIQIVPNNHYLFFGTEVRIMNLSSYHWFGFNHNQPGSTAAEVMGVVIQEFDENKELVWQWKGHDHYQFADVNQVWLMNPNKVDWTHANAVELDNDGNILLSLRHFNEITKINRSTGAIIWRLGGKQNQFLFPNDPLRFTGQHDIRRISESTISLFDNGQYTVPKVSRGLEYSLDEVNKVATLVWEYIYDSTMYSLACGSHQVVGNGNHLVDFGFANAGGFPWGVVVKNDKSPVLEFHYPPGFISYRAFNYPTLPWQLNRPEIECKKIGENYYLVAEQGHSEYNWSTGNSSPSILITEPGEYWVYVPYGGGFISSEHIYITDVLNPCLYTSVPKNVTPTDFRLSVSPNPASEVVRVVFDVPAPSTVSISLSNMLGTAVEQPIQGEYSQGSHEFFINVSALEKGVYLLSMLAEKKRVVQKLIVR